MTTTLDTPKEKSSLPQDIGGQESSSGRWSLVDQTAVSLQDELNIFPTDGGKRRSTAIGFIESGGDDASLHDLL